jgi:hypothetical protein
MMTDDDTLKQLLRINDELLQLCKFLNEKRDMETSSRLYTPRGRPHSSSDRSGQEQIALMMQTYKGYFIAGSALMVHPFSPEWYVGGSVLVPGRSSSVIEITRFQVQRFTVSIRELDCPACGRRMPGGANG